VAWLGTATARRSPAKTRIYKVRPQRRRGPTLGDGGEGAVSNSDVMVSWAKEGEVEQSNTEAEGEKGRTLWRVVLLLQRPPSPGNALAMSVLDD